MPNNSLRALAAVPSNGAGAAVSSGPPAAWLTVGGAGGQPMTNAQTDGYAVCATGAAARPQVAVASVAGPAVAAGSVAATANCPAGTVLLGGGASTSVPASTFAPSLHLIGSYPSDGAGAAAANGAAPTSWTAVAASGGAAVTGATTSAYAVCAPAGVVSVQVATVTANGPQTASTPQQLTVPCPAGSTVLGGGVNITLNGGTPQQGVHVTGDYPSVGPAPVAAGGTATDWTAITQSGGQATPGTVSSGFALCGVRA